SDRTVLLNRPLSRLVDAATSSVVLMPDGNIPVDGRWPQFDSELDGLRFTAIVDSVALAPIPPPDAVRRLNSASLSMPDSIAPGEIVSIFGQGLGSAGGAVFHLDRQGAGCLACWVRHVGCSMNCPYQCHTPTGSR